LDWFFFPLEVNVYSIPINIVYHVANRPSPSLSLNGSVADINTKSIASIDSKGAPIARNEAYSLNFTLQVNGYDPRLDKPLPYGADFKGGIPACTQQLRIPGQIGYLSQDIINYGVVPQYSSSHRMIMLKNISEQEIDFNFNDNTSYLLLLGLVSVYPSTGRIERGQHAMINVTVNAKNTCAFSFKHRIKVTVRECIPVLKRRYYLISIMF